MLAFNGKAHGSTDRPRRSAPDVAADLEHFRLGQLLASQNTSASRDAAPLGEGDCGSAIYDPVRVDQTVRRSLRVKTRKALSEHILFDSNVSSVGNGYFKPLLGVVLVYLFVIMRKRLGESQYGTLRQSSESKILGVWRSNGVRLRH